MRLSDGEGKIRKMLELAETQSKVQSCLEGKGVRGERERERVEFFAQSEDVSCIEAGNEKKLRFRMAKDQGARLQSRNRCGSCKIGPASGREWD